MTGERSRCKRHPIRVVARRTGLSRDLLRAWEVRYAAVQPERTAGGQRLYSDDDIERLRLIQQALEAGRRIGQLATLPTEELAQLVGEDQRAARDAPGGGAREQLSPLSGDAGSGYCRSRRLAGDLHGRRPAGGFDCQGRRADRGTRRCPEPHLPSKRCGAR